jgi:hypothetical protein
VSNVSPAVHDDGQIGLQAAVSDAIDTRERMVALARDVIAACDAHELDARLLGGVAIAARCPNARPPGPLTRSYSDLDLVTARRNARKLEPVLEQVGLIADRRFNAAHGHERLRFEHEDGVHIDVFLDRFRLCHVLPLTDRLNVNEVTVPLADLLLTKLQVATPDHKDITDATVLLLDHEFGASDDQINLPYVVGLLASDWGWWRTTQDTLGILEEHLGSLGLSAEQQGHVREQIGTLREAIEREPKSRRWRLRAKVGDRRPWREEPEEVR